MSADPSDSPQSKTSRGNFVSDVRADLRASLRDRRFLWTAAYFALALLGVMMGVFTIASAVDRSSFGSSDLLQVVIALFLIALAFSVLTFIHNAVVRWDCHSCAKRLESNVEWTCGSCDRDNMARTFLDNCEHCKALPKAFECYHCGTTTFLVTGTRDDRTRARKKTAPRPGESMDEARKREIKEREHERDKLKLDIELAGLRAKLNPPRSEKPDPSQQRMDRLWRQIEDAEIDCKTIQQTAVKEKLLHADIDVNPDLDESQKRQMKEIVSRKFEVIRAELGGDIHV